MLITFEGGEGAGKSTQIKLLADALRQIGHEVFATRCPGGEPFAEAIRALLLGTGTDVCAHTEALLFAAARAQVTERILRPHLERGEIVLMDRFIDSTIVYQGHARGLNTTQLRKLNEFATLGLIPDITLLIDIDPKVGLGRQSVRNRMEDEPLAFHETIRAGFLAEARLALERFVIIDGTLNISNAHEFILGEVLRRL